MSWSNNVVFTSSNLLIAQTAAVKFNYNQDCIRLLVILQKVATVYICWFIIGKKGKQSVGILVLFEIIIRYVFSCITQYPKAH